MVQRSTAIRAALVVVLGVLAVAAGIGLTSAPSPSASPTGSDLVGVSTLPINPTPTPGLPGPPNPASPGPGSPYTFDDEFNGPGLSSTWQQHIDCCGQIVAVDPSLATVADGMLSMSVARRSDGWYGSLIDTLSSWTQTYGTFAARIKVPTGAGLWPAFWSYGGSGSDAEVDTMEVCGNPIGANHGDDVSLLHTTVHWEHGSREFDTRTVDMSQDFHVYAVDWRAMSMTFSIDGNVIWTFTDTAHIPQSPLPVILDLGVGGQWCGPPTASTPGNATMLVDWVRVSP